MSNRELKVVIDPENFDPAFCVVYDAVLSMAEDFTEEGWEDESISLDDLLNAIRDCASSAVNDNKGHYSVPSNKMNLMISLLAHLE